jgi:hypothetical protein
MPRQGCASYLSQYQINKAKKIKALICAIMHFKKTFFGAYFKVGDT